MTAEEFERVHEQATLADLYDAITHPLAGVLLHTCRLCGAAVTTEHLDRHTQWHRAVSGETP